MRVPDTDSCVEVGAADLEDGSNGLQVRRGSEPTLHQDTLPPQRQVCTCLNLIIEFCGWVFVLYRSSYLRNNGPRVNQSAGT